MTPFQEALNEETKACARNYHDHQLKLVRQLEKVEKEKLYAVLGLGSLFQYCLTVLNLTESETCMLTGVMRKSAAIPMLRDALDNRELSVSRTKRIASVINNENAKLWIERAKAMKQKELELAVAIESPRSGSQERISPLSAERREVRLTISAETEAQLNRAREVLRTQTLEETIEKLTHFYLKKNDPLEKKSHSLRNSPRPMHRPTPKSVKNRALIRDKGACVHIDANGNRCGSRRYIEVHHIKPFSEGGDHSLNNLATLCHGHHRGIHLKSLAKLSA